MEPEISTSEDNPLLSLPHELRTYILVLELNDIIKNNSILDPYKGVGKYIKNSISICKCFRILKNDLYLIAKAIAKEHFAAKESYLDQEELDNQLIDIMSNTYSAENVMKAAALIIAGANPNIQLPYHQQYRGSDYKNTPLSKIAKTQQFTNLIPLLIFHGVDINAQLGCFKEPPIVMATSHDNYELVKFLMDNGADVNARSAGGWTAYSLDKRANGGHGNIQRLIKESGKLAEEETQAFCLLF